MPSFGRYSSITGSLLDELEGRVQGRDLDEPQATARWVPTVKRIEDPRRDVEEIVSVLDAGEVPELRPSYLMARWRQKAHVNETDSGVATFDGRPCCFQAILAVQGRLHHLRLPHRFVCENCGATYEIAGEMR